MASPSMEIPAIHGWNMPSVVENRDEMYGGCDGSSFHPWMGESTDGMRYSDNDVGNDL